MVRLTLSVLARLSVQATSSTKKLSDIIAKKLAAALAKGPPLFLCPWMDGQKIAPAFSAVPPSMAVVFRGRMDAQERRLKRTDSP